MSELLVAQCPFCQTRFRLSQEHLQAAAGNVRCGACLKVFNAHMAIAGEPQPASASGAQSAPAEPRQPEKAAARSGPLLIHDDLDLDDLDLEALGLDESILDEINPAARTEEPVDQHQPDQTEFQLELDSEPEPTWEEAAEQSDIESDAALADSEPDPWDRLDEPDSKPADGSEVLGHAPESADDSDDDHDLHEDFLATPTARDFAPGTETGVEKAETASAEPAEQSGIFLRDRPNEAAGTNARSTVEPVPHQESEPRAGAEERQEPAIGSLINLPDLSEEPLLLYQQPVARRSRYRPLWILLSILALLGLAAQALYYNFNTLAHGEHSRPYLEQLCLLAGCELPARVDISLVRSSNLMVRPHPEYPKALAIDVILYNRAEFAQPFPVLRMTFNDTRGSEVISKRFRPDEYLGGELAGATLMPPQTPVHVALDMLDPGPEAAGYQLDFLSP